jgi:sarcosine oxidase
VAERAEVAVVGAGIMGSATARALARGGHDVLLLEQFELGHSRGSSHGEARIFRLVYGDPSWVRLAQRALPLWCELEAESGESILTTRGSVDLGPGTDERAAALAECGVDFDVVDGADLGSRYPLRVEGGTAALLQADGGVLNAAAAQRAFRRGLRVLERTRVTGIEEGRVRVEGGTIEARVVVVTAGAWVARLVGPLGMELPVTPTRETVAYFGVRNGFPTVIDWRVPDGYELPRSGDSVYALPSPQGLKVGVHRTGPPTDPDEDGEVDLEAIRCATDWVGRYVEGAEPEPARTETCLYTNTPDESFVLERHERVVVGSPCSGHGFKFAPVVGEELAALAVEAL